MLTDQMIIGRLSFIKYIHRTAIEQSLKPEPLCSASILWFHDSVELFLQLASEHLNAGKSNVSFMEYWDLLKKSKKELSQKESMRRLNSARVELKHHGTRPSKFDIEGFRASVTNFFVENTPLIFGIDYSELSLIDLIQCENARRTLKEAQELLQSNERADSLDRVSLAFDQLIMDYEERKTEMFGISPFYFGRTSQPAKTDVTSHLHRPGIAGLDMGPFVAMLTQVVNGVDAALAKVVDLMNSENQVLLDAIRIISLGIDYRKYTKFRLLVPTVQWAAGRTNYHIYRRQDTMPDADNVRYCIDFVIECAITLQEFDFTVSRHPFLEVG